MSSSRSDIIDEGAQFPTSKLHRTVRTIEEEEEEEEDDDDSQEPW